MQAVYRKKKPCLSLLLSLSTGHLKLKDQYEVRGAFGGGGGNFQI